MAEIRKFAPSKGGTIAQALSKAMGESVRPVAPGATPPEREPRKQAQAGPTATSAAIWDPFLRAQPRLSGRSTGADDASGPTA